MPFSSSNTGSTDLRETLVQQPNTAATLSTLSSCRAFSANSGQLDAGSTTTASSLLPSRPPFLFCSSISISMTSFSVVSLIAMVPESECRMPTLIVGADCAPARRAMKGAATLAAASESAVRRDKRRDMVMKPLCFFGSRATVTAKSVLHCSKIYAKPRCGADKAFRRRTKMELLKFQAALPRT